ncbi:hypothetical protein CC79DRAFT_433493 [Sarocladium strictum]
MFGFTNNNHGHGGHEDDDEMCNRIHCLSGRYSSTASGPCRRCEHFINQGIYTNPDTAAEAHALRRQADTRDFNERRETVQDESHRGFGKRDRLNAQNNRGAFASSDVPRERSTSTSYSGEHPSAAGSAQITQQSHRHPLMQQAWNDAVAGPSTGHAHAGPVRAPAPNTTSPVRERAFASTSTGGCYPGSARMRQLSSNTSKPAPPRTETTRQGIERPVASADAPTGSAGAAALEQARNNFQMRHPVHFASTVTPPGSDPITRPRAVHQPNPSRTSQVPQAPVLRLRRGQSNLASDFAHGSTSSQQGPVQKTPALANDPNTSVPQDANMPRFPPAAHLAENIRGHRYEDQILSQAMPRPQSSFDITPPRDPSVPQIASSVDSSDTPGNRSSQQILAPVLPPAPPGFELTGHQEPNTPRIPAPSHFPDTGPVTPEHHSSWARNLPARPDYGNPVVQVTPPDPSSSGPATETDEEANRSPVVSSTVEERAALITDRLEEGEEDFRPNLDNGTDNSTVRRVWD